jgi:hypothetical protein
MPGGDVKVSRIIAEKADKNVKKMCKAFNCDSISNVEVVIGERYSSEYEVRNSSILQF